MLPETLETLETLETGVAVLRPLEKTDLPTIIGHLNEPALSQWLAAIPHPFGMEDGLELLEFSQDPASNVRVIEVDGRVTGCISLGAAVWFWLEPTASGRGTMSEVLRPALQRMFNAGSGPLVATSRIDNAPSIALLTKLGFSRRPNQRRMFFSSTGSSKPCWDYVLTPEQWFFLNPPRWHHRGLIIRPATMRDSGRLSQLLQGHSVGPSEVWRLPEGIEHFVESHRFRRPDQGLFIVEDSFETPIGAILISEPGGQERYIFSSKEKMDSCLESVSSFTKSLPQNQ